jgi:hypothetical protein
MKKIEIKNVFNNSVVGEDKVYILVSEEEAKDLNSALETIEKYRKIGSDAYKGSYGHKPEEADFCSYAYSVKKNELVITIRNGAIG